MERDESSDYPCFYKLMFNTLNSEKLRIPPKFVKHILKDLDAKATLLGPSGNRCSVTVEFSGINIYLQDGWQEFMRENSLGDNEFLLFTYQGNMCFRAEVFNATGLKRSASAGRANLRKKRGRPGTGPSTPKPCKDTSGGKTRPVRKQNEERSAGEKVQREQSLLPITWFQELENEENHDTGTGNQSKQMEIAGNLNCPTLSGGEDSKEEESRVWRKAKSFVSKNPYVSVLMTHSLARGCPMHFRCSFAQAHLPEFDTKMLLLNQNGEVWHARYKTRPKKYYCLSSGWRTFMLANNIHVGDICILELIDETKFQVHVIDGS